MSRTRCAAALTALLLAPAWAGAAFDCTLVFRLQNNVTLGSLQWDTDYADTPGYFLENGGNVDCVGLVQGALYSSNDVDDEELLDTGLLSLDGFHGPLDVSACEFMASRLPTAADFAMTVTEASSPDLTPVAPTPTVGIASIECDDVGAICGDAIAEADEQCDDGNDNETDACLSDCSLAFCGDGFLRSGFEECDDGNTEGGDSCSESCELEPLCGDATGDRRILASDALRILQLAVRLDVECPAYLCNVDGSDGVAASDALRVLRRSVDLPTTLTCGIPTALMIRLTTPKNLGALQINIGYQEVSGDIAGDGDTVECQTMHAGVESAFNDKPERVLSASFASVTGIRGPGTVARCGFTASASVEPADFTISILDAKDRNGNTVSKPGMRVVPD